MAKTLENQTENTEETTETKRERLFTPESIDSLVETIYNPNCKFTRENKRFTTVSLPGSFEISFIFENEKSRTPDGFTFRTKVHALQKDVDFTCKIGKYAQAIYMACAMARD